MSNVSIVIPTFNRAHYLEQTIESCLKQTVNCEIIVCDHGSTDSTPDVVEKFGSRLTYVRRERDFGPHFCWLEGLLHASRELVHLQFDDDLIRSTFVEELSIKIDDNVGFAFCSATILFDDGNESDHLKNAFKQSIVSTSEAEKYLLKNMVSPGCIVLRKKDAIDALYQGRLPLQRYDYHGVGPDYLITLLTLLRYENIAYVNKPLAQFRAHQQSITIAAQSSKNSQEEITLAYQEVRKYYRQQKLAKLLQKLSIN